MRIRNILIKTYNPALNPSLQNHLHSLLLTLYRRSDGTFGFHCSASFLTEASLFPFVSLQCWLDLIRSHQTFRGDERREVLLCYLSLWSEMENPDICLMRRKWTGTSGQNCDRYQERTKSVSVILVFKESGNESKVGQMDQFNAESRGALSQLGVSAELTQMFYPKFFKKK